MSESAAITSQRKIIAMTSLAMVAFAANSILCRMSLGANLIDATSFTTIRLTSGASCLLAIIFWRTKGRGKGPGNGPSKVPGLSFTRIPAIISLFIYMFCFSLAYQSLTAGTGALLLFGFVQLTMLSTAIYLGERLSAIAWMGVLMASSGLVFLVLPGLASPDPGNSALMALAGLAWGIYSILGSSSGDATATTAANFLYATPLAVIASVLNLDSFFISWQGAFLSIASGAIASGMGYAIWYVALKNIQASSAAIVQLSVPALATLGGALFLAEPLTIHILVATVLTIGGIAIVLSRRYGSHPSTR